MAYLDLTDRFDTTAATPLQHSPFEAAEWRVILMAGSEGLSSLSERGPVARFFARLIGAPVIRRLASPRLEALRRFSVLAWHYSYALPVSAVSAMLNAGFSEAQLDYALASITRFRDRRRGA